MPQVLPELVVRVPGQEPEAALPLAQERVQVVQVPDRVVVPVLVKGQVRVTVLAKGPVQGLDRERVLEPVPGLVKALGLAKAPAVKVVVRVAREQEPEQVPGQVRLALPPVVLEAGVVAQVRSQNSSSQRSRYPFRRLRYHRIQSAHHLPASGSTSS